VLRIVICFALLTSVAHAGAILNTLQSSGDGDPGWSGGLDGMFSGSGGNTEKILVEAGGSVQFRGTASRLRLQISGGYEESRREVTARNVVAHLRHNRDLGAGWATVTFGQVQSNPFQRLSSRVLAGMGVRRRFGNDADHRLTLGVTPMLESERLEHEDGHLARGRLSTFLTLSQRLTAATTVSAMGFWQPLFSDLADARAVGNLTVITDLTGNVSLKIGAAVEHDSRPADGVEKTDWNSYAGVGVTF